MGWRIIAIIHILGFDPSTYKPTHTHIYIHIYTYIQSYKYVSMFNTLWLFKVATDRKTTIFKR